MRAYGAMASERNGEGGLAGDLEMERLGSKAGSDDFVTVFEKDLDDDEVSASHQPIPHRTTSAPLSLSSADFS